MIRKIFLPLLVVVLSAGLALAVTTKPTITIAKGTVEKIDVATKTISVTVKGATKNFTFNDKSFFLEGKNKMKADDLKPGDRISITADSKNYIRKADITATTLSPAPPKP